MTDDTTTPPGHGDGSIGAEGPPSEPDGATPAEPEGTVAAAGERVPPGGGKPPGGGGPHPASNRYPQRHKHRVLRRTLQVLGTLAVLAVIGAAALFFYANYRINKHSHHCAACVPVAKATGGAPASPFNVLVMASDTRSGLSAAEAKLLDPNNVNLNSGQRADSIALVHVEPATGKAVVISIPRDLRVPAPSGGYEKINAYFNSGPNSMVAEVSALTGLPIEHYIAVDFTSFGEITQALGGVDVYFNRAINDPNSGLDQPKGCDLLSGAQALAFVRDRDTDSDFGRIARQRLFVTLMINKVLTPGTLLNPIKVANLVNLGLSSLEHDSGLTLTGLLSLLKHFHNFNSSDIDFRVLPSYPNGALIGGASYVIESTPQANALLAALRDGTPLPDYGIQGVNPILPSQVPVTVLNASGSSTAGSEAAAKLRTKGFPVVAIGDATGPPVTETAVYYTPGNQAPAQFLQQQAYPAAPLEPLSDTIAVRGDPSAVVVLGPDALAPPSTGTSPTPTATPSGAQPAGPAIAIDTSSFGAPC
jgi:LCP family protein required for cell wall assembly